MSLTDELEKALEQQYRRNSVEHALRQLSDSDRKAWEHHLDGGVIPQRELARLLTRHSGIEVNHKQVSDYKRRALL